MEDLFTGVIITRDAIVEGRLTLSGYGYRWLAIRHETGA
jgi:hypothetical protein